MGQSAGRLKQKLLEVPSEKTVDRGLCLMKGRMGPARKKGATKMWAGEAGQYLRKQLPGSSAAARILRVLGAAGMLKGTWGCSCRTGQGRQRRRQGGCSS